ncbi:MAG: DUF2892 domain-containing protein [Bacteroidales bacterium]|nr:DUF2892 domain-containing protein [Bacteroidales bacterium]
MKNKSLFKYYKNELLAFGLFLVGAALSMLGLIRTVPLIAGIAGVVILSTGLFYFCLRYTSETTYKDFYKENYEIEHETIEDDIRQSMAYHRYQEAVINRYESACRDLGITEEQKNWLLQLLTDEKDRVDEELKAEGGGHI